MRSQHIEVEFRSIVLAVHPELVDGFFFLRISAIIFSLSFSRGAHSKVVLRGIRIAEAGVRFSLGPHFRIFHNRRGYAAVLCSPIV